MERIPKSFQLGPFKIRVVIVSKTRMRELCEDEDDNLGRWSPQESIIYVRRVSKEFPKEMQLQTFWHEFFHALFDTLGYNKLSQKEQLVDQCGLMMMQAQQTFRYT